ncbi:aminotransferase class V-fold PLP-dependent enzyme [Mycoplasmopsis mucosicanis]|uniref:Aminotransferase class V-fold PLP-dependent enzyme n=1 Tax=Mycoplasmopsis mucosicanis TaxID=458208 RepID=A0A507SKX9_9BACT|nr:aminotransferase class V-fold PLP-dependent enzyme [Mycoplasmopsis mucosicanis]TQC51606.1 aminotransferase class V-fold PLP-dependent enzyme [Mycoplasmopsis mucosicanis]
MKSLRDHFKMTKKIIYFDNAALVLKPDIAVKACSDFYNKYSVSVRTSNSKLGIKNANLIDDLRRKIASLLNTNLIETSIIFTSGTTNSLNKFARLVEKKISHNDQIIIEAQNHSSNFIPWVELSKQSKADLSIVQDVYLAINNKTKLIALSQVTNNFNVQQDLDKIYQKATEVGAIVVNDAAQALVYEPVSMQNCDVVAFSANKFYGPTGLGVLAIKNKLLKDLDPVDFGGGSVLNIDTNGEWIKSNNISLFEPGTANFSAMYMFDKSIDFFNEYIGYEKTRKVLKNVCFYAYKELKKVPNLILYSQPGDHIILFNIKGCDSHDVAHYLGMNDIYVRSGVFCAHYLKNIKNENSYVRVSLAIYNTKREIRKLVEVLKKGGDFVII